MTADPPDAAHDNRQPVAERPTVPPEYGVPASRGGLLSWGPLEERLRDANAYWVATSGSSGRPRVRPVDGIWVDGTLFVGGSPATGWVRDLRANPRVSVHLDAVSDVLILQGEAEALDAGVDASLAALLAAESNRKYPQYGPRAASDYVGKPAGFAIRPSTALAWKHFPKDVTKFRFR